MKNLNQVYEVKLPGCPANKITVSEAQKYESLAKYINYVEKEGCHGVTLTDGTKINKVEK